MELNLVGKVALVTGGGRGLGAAVCRLLAEEGADVAVNYRQSAAAAEALARTLGERQRGRALAVCADVAEEFHVAAMFDRIEAAWGPVDILVNNAALCPTAPAVDWTLAQWNEVVAANLTGAFLCCREMARRAMAAGRGGRIVNVSSVAARLGSTSGHAPYDAGKGALDALTVTLAREWAAAGIAVNGVAPGMLRTEMTEDVLRRREAEYVARIPLRRIGQPEEVARVIVFLASEAASYMTGTIVNVSGGMMLGP